MKIAAACFCLLATSLWSLRSDLGNEQTYNSSAIKTATAAAPTAVAACAACNLSATNRIATFGHSIAAGANCALADTDGFRAYVMQGLCNNALSFRFVGSNTRPAAGSAIACNKTDAVGGRTISQVYADLSAIPTIMPTPSANDAVWIGPALTNDLSNGQTEAYMEAGMKACITKTASLGPMKIYVVNDAYRTDGGTFDASLMLTAASNAFTWAQAQGYNVKFVDIYSTMSAGDVCGDHVHLQDSGYSKGAVALTNAMSN